MPKLIEAPKHMIDNNLHAAVDILYAIQQRIKALQLREKELTDQIKADMPDMEGGCIIISSTEFSAGDPYYVSLSGGSKSSIDHEKLLSLGVDPVTIAHATVRAGYSPLRIKASKPVVELPAKRRRK